MLIHFGVETSPSTTRALPETGSAEGVGQGETAAEGTEIGRRHFIQIAPIQQNATAIHIPLHTEKADFLQVLVTFVQCYYNNREFYILNTLNYCTLLSNKIKSKLLHVALVSRPQ
jgi:hypothetical protein